MSNYEQLVKALRYCAESGDFKCGKDCPMHTEYPNCLTKMDTDAADAIEALQAEIRESMQKCAECGDEQEQKVKALQAEVKILKVSGREAYFEGLAAEPKRGEIVRCRECLHYNAGFECLVEGYGIERDPDWFCGDGKRKAQDGQD